MPVGLTSSTSQYILVYSFFTGIFSSSVKYVHTISTYFTAALYTVSQKNVPPLICYNFYVHGLIATIFGKNVVEKVGNQKPYFIFPPHMTNASAVPGETGNPKMASFHLKAACFFYQKPTKHSYKYHLVRAEPPFAVKMIGPRKAA